MVSPKQTLSIPVMFASTALFTTNETVSFSIPQKLIPVKLSSISTLESEAVLVYSVETPFRELIVPVPEIILHVIEL